MNAMAFLSNLAGGDLLIILLIVLVLFGAKKLPELARGLGEAMKEFNKAKDDLSNELYREPKQDLTRTAAPVEKKPGGTT